LYDVTSYINLFYKCIGKHRDPVSFPTRRSSDLPPGRPGEACAVCWSVDAPGAQVAVDVLDHQDSVGNGRATRDGRTTGARARRRSEEHTSELQSRENLVCRLLLVKKKCEKP